MTVEELKKYLYDEYPGLESQWPDKIEVDAETYGNVCQFLFEKCLRDDGLYFEWDVNELGKRPFRQKIISLFLGPNNGIMFKSVELIKK